MIGRDISDPAKESLVRFLAAFAILWMPFYNFASSRGHALSSTPLVYSIVVLFVALIPFLIIMIKYKKYFQSIFFSVLICISLDIQFDWFKNIISILTFISVMVVCFALRSNINAILAVIFNTMLISSIALSWMQEGAMEEPHKEPSAAAANNEGIGDEALPMMVHLVLDEHAGVAGIPEDVPGGRKLRSDLRDFYKSNGFALFGNAFAQYILSRNSISSTLNFTSGTGPNEWYFGTEPYVLKESEYFRRLNEIGYNIFVYQSTYLDYCAELSALIDHCNTYRHDGTDWMSEIQLSHFGEFQVLFAMYLRRSDIFEKIAKIHVKINRLLNRVDMRFPPIMEWNGSTAAMNGMTAFRRFVGEVSRGLGGTVYFAHILLPHGPYAFDRDCQIRPSVFDWPVNVPLHSKDNTQASREFRYGSYFEQLRCTLKMVGFLFDELRSADKFADATIIIHGDHGSRIYMNQLKMKNYEKLAVSDYLDGFSTLFAVKRVGLTANYEGSAVTLSQLLDHFSTNRTDWPSEQPPLHVYLGGMEDNTWVEVPWPESGRDH